MKRMVESILRFRNLKKVGLLTDIVIAIPLLWFFLERMELPNLLGRLDHPSDQRRPFTEDDFEWAKQIWNYAHFILVRCLKVKNPCLLRSLILFRYLRRRGLEAHIHFGIKRNVSPLEGHSWLSLNGKYFLEEEDPQSTYTDVYTYPLGKS